MNKVTKLDDIPCRFKLTKSKAYLELLDKSTEDKIWVIVNVKTLIIVRLEIELLYVLTVVFTYQLKSNDMSAFSSPICAICNKFISPTRPHNCTNADDKPRDSCSFNSTK